MPAGRAAASRLVGGRPRDGPGDADAPGQVTAPAASSRAARWALEHLRARRAATVGAPGRALPAR